MNLALTSLLLIALPMMVRSRPRFECPPAALIRPCTCTTQPQRLVRCDSLDTVRAALADLFPEPLPTLEITNVSSLPHHALGDVRVKRLKVVDGDIVGIHDDAFVGQDSLGLLFLSGDHLTDVPTEALKRLPGLRTLNLNGNYIDKIGADSFDPESRIRFLFLFGNRVSAIDRGAFPRSLNSLVLSSNRLSTLNGSLRHLDSLEIFLANDNELRSLKGEFQGLTRLNHLGLEGNGLSSIEGAFNDLPSLTNLNIANNRLRHLEDLYPLKHLRSLNVSDNQITSLGTNVFRSLSGITQLDLSGNRIRNVCQAIRPLHQLAILRLSDMGLTSLDYDCLKGMKGLQSLDLSLNGLTNIDVVTGHFFPQLRFLYVQGNHLQNFRHGLKNLKNLYELDISFNRFANLKRQHFIHNSHLRNFNIEGNKWDCSDSLLWDNFAYLESHEVDLIGLPLC